MRPKFDIVIWAPVGYGGDDTDGIRMSPAREVDLLGGGYQIGMRLRTRS